MSDTFPAFSINEVESFCFHLHCTYKRKTKPRVAILKDVRKICSTRKWKFYNVLQQSRIWVMADTVPHFSFKEVERFCFHLHCIYEGKTKQRSTIHKNTRKICSTRKWKFYNILEKKRVWVMAKIVPDFGNKEVERLSLSFALYL